MEPRGEFSGCSSAALIALCLAATLVGGCFVLIAPRSRHFLPAEIRPGITRSQAEAILKVKISVREFEAGAPAPPGCRGFYILTRKGNKLYYALYFDRDDVLTGIAAEEL
jgi:hypothetical protein